MSLSLQSLLLANRCLVALSEERRHAVSAQFNLPIESVATTTDHPGWHKLYYGVTAKKAEKHLAELAKDFPAVAALLAPAVAQSLLDLAAADEADDYILALWRNNQLPAPMPDSLRDRLAAKK